MFVFVFVAGQERFIGSDGIDIAAANVVMNSLILREGGLIR